MPVAKNSVYISFSVYVYLLFYVWGGGEGGNSVHVGLRRLISKNDGDDLVLRFRWDG